jgi:RNA polymerase sigma-70 factor, ECF subfamily
LHVHALHPEPVAIDEHTTTRLGLAAPRLVAQPSERSSEDEVLRLFDECAPALARYVRACGLSADAADDVVQEAFIALFRHVGLGRSRRNLRAWLFTVAHRLALKQREHAARRRSAEIPLDGQVAGAASDLTEDPEGRLLAHQHQQRLRSVVRALPERHRHCLFLRAEGLRYREIAGVLGVSLGGVAKMVTHAVLRLTHAGQE